MNEPFTTDVPGDLNLMDEAAPLDVPDGLVDRAQMPHEVLVVEDDSISARLILQILKTLGFSAKWVTDGIQALDELSKRRYPIVITDWVMPHMDGIELCGMIRGFGGPYTYVVLLTSMGEVADRIKAFDAGIDDFLTKPPDRDELRVRLKSAVRVVEAEAELRRRQGELERTSEQVKVSNSKLSLASKRFQELFNGLPVSCFTVDRSGKLQEWNRASETLFGVKSSSVLNKQVADVLNQISTDPSMQLLLKATHDGVFAEGIEWSFARADGSRCYLMGSTIPLMASEAEVLGSICANIDITARILAEQEVHESIRRQNELTKELEIQKEKLEEANAWLENLAVTDGLTGLKNHRNFRERLEDTFGYHKRHELALSLVLLDVDDFKHFNDDMGHLEGDAVLRQIAGLLKQHCRSHEPPARYGGEEFAVILAGATEEQAVEAAERLRLAIESAPWVHRRVTASFGVSTLTPDITSVDQLIVLADRALYTSKRRGKNCVTHASELVVT